MRYPGFIGDQNLSQSLTADSELTINWYREQLPQYGKNQFALYPTPGGNPWTTVSNIGFRGGISVNGRTFAVMGVGFYELFVDTTTILRGTVAQDQYPATVTYNGVAGAQLFITSGSNGYCFDLNTNTLTLELTGDATMGGMLNGYFLAFNVLTSTFRISDLNDGTTWDPTQFATRSTSPDPWKSMVVVQQPAGIWLIGEQSGDVWYDQGNFPFPFAPIPGATFRFGTVGPFAVTVAGDRVMWVSQTTDGAGPVVMARGYAPVIISTPAINALISGYQDTAGITDAECWTYQDQGHIFTVVTFAAANATLVYDQILNSWHQRGKWNASAGQYDFWPPRQHIFAFGKHLVGERGSGTIAEMDIIWPTEFDGAYIRRLRRAPSIFRENRQVLLRRLEIFLESGLGTLTGQGSNPMVMLRTSDDGGKTWLPERTASSGRVGDYTKRVFWTRFGLPRDRVFELTVTDPITNWRIIDAFINNDGPQQVG